MSRASARLDQSQPAVSAALKRLRDFLGDPLLQPLRHHHDAARASGDLYVVISNLLQVPKHLRITTLLEDDAVYWVGCDYPSAGLQLTVTHYSNGAHIVHLTYCVR